VRDVHARRIGAVVAEEERRVVLTPGIRLVTLHTRRRRPRVHQAVPAMRAVRAMSTVWAVHMRRHERRPGAVRVARRGGRMVWRAPWCSRKGRAWWRGTGVGRTCTLQCNGRLLVVRVGEVLAAMGVQEIQQPELVLVVVLIRLCRRKGRELNALYHPHHAGPHVSVGTAHHHLPSQRTHLLASRGSLALCTYVVLRERADREIARPGCVGDEPELPCVIHELFCRELRLQQRHPHHQPTERLSRNPHTPTYQVDRGRWLLPLGLGLGRRRRLWWRSR